MKFKKRILLFLFVLAALALGYYTYHSYQDEYRPQSLREQFGAVSHKSALKDETPAKKFVPRKEFHENSGYKRSSDKDIALVVGDAKDSILSSLQEELAALERGNTECELEFNEILPPDQIIDPQGNFFTEPDLFNPTLKSSFNKYRFSNGRDAANAFTQKIEDLLYNYNEISASDFSVILRAPLVCRQSNLTVYLETIVEINEETGLSDKVKFQVVSEVTQQLKASLSNDQLQDNILMALTLLKGVGLIAGVQQGFFTELEEIYDSLTQDYSNIYEKKPEDKMIENPGDVYNEYRYRQKAAAQVLIEIINDNFPSYGP